MLQPRFRTCIDALTGYLLNVHTISIQTLNDIWMPQTRFHTYIDAFTVHADLSSQNLSSPVSVSSGCHHQIALVVTIIASKSFHAAYARRAIVGNCNGCCFIGTDSMRFIRCARHWHPYKSWCSRGEKMCWLGWKKGTLMCAGPA